jgi:hypothetical protein
VTARFSTRAVCEMMRLPATCGEHSDASDRSCFVRRASTGRYRATVVRRIESTLADQSCPAASQRQRCLSNVLLASGAPVLSRRDVQ